MEGLLDPERDVEKNRPLDGDHVKNLRTPNQLLLTFGSMSGYGSYGRCFFECNKSIYMYSIYTVSSWVCWGKIRIALLMLALPVPLWRLFCPTCQETNP